MWRTALAYLYAAVLALALQAVSLHNDAKSTLFWRAVLARIAPGTLPPSIYCDLLDRARVPRNAEICGAAPRPRGVQPPPADQPAP